MLRSVQLWLLTATLAVPGSCLAAQIQPVGYACTPEGCSACNEGCQNGCNNGCNGYGNCYDCNGRCTPRQTWRDNCMDWTGHCGPVGRAAPLGCAGCSLSEVLLRHQSRSGFRLGTTRPVPGQSDEYRLRGVLQLRWRRLHGSSHGVSADRHDTAGLQLCTRSHVATQPGHDSSRAITVCLPCPCLSRWRLLWQLSGWRMHARTHHQSAGFRWLLPRLYVSGCSRADNPVAAAGFQHRRCGSHESSFDACAARCADEGHSCDEPDDISRQGDPSDVSAGGSAETRSASCCCSSATRSQGNPTTAENRGKVSWLVWSAVSGRSAVLSNCRTSLI